MKKNALMSMSVQMRKTSRNKLIRWKRWSASAIYCYLRGCICRGCIYENFFTDKNFRCQMKNAVMQLVQTIGIPEGVKTKTILEDDEEN